MSPGSVFLIGGIRRDCNLEERSSHLEKVIGDKPRTSSLHCGPKCKLGRAAGFPQSSLEWSEDMSRANQDGEG